MVKFSKVTAAVALLALGASAQASFVIDTFNVGQGTFALPFADITATAAPATTSTLGVSNYGTNIGNGVGGSVVGAVTDIVGGQRDLAIVKSAQGSGAVQSVQGYVDNGSFEFNSPNGTAGYAVLRWDGAGTSFNQAINIGGLGGLNWSALGVGVSVTTLFADQAFTITMQAWTETAPAVFTLT